MFKMLLKNIDVIFHDRNCSWYKKNIKILPLFPTGALQIGVEESNLFLKNREKKRQKEGLPLPQPASSDEDVEESAPQGSSATAAQERGEDAELADDTSIHSGLQKSLQSPFFLPFVMLLFIPSYSLGIMFLDVSFQSLIMLLFFGTLVKAAFAFDNNFLFLFDS